MKVSKNGIRLTSPPNLHIQALSGASIHPVCRTKVASGTGWSVVLRGYCTPSSVYAASQITDEVLNSTFCLVEHALNAHPLTPVSAGPSALGATTPNHFLFGNQAIATRVGVDDFDHRKRYARAQFYANAMWARWLKEYLPALNRRSKWQTPAEQHLKVGDLVWIVEESNPRGTIQLLGLKYSGTAPKASPTPPSSGSLVHPLVKLVPFLPTFSSGPEDITA